MPYRASCLCGQVVLELIGEPVTTSHCHCRMCQKQHGAAYASYARFRRDQLHYLSGEASVRDYPSSGEVVRRFCGDCGSNLEWFSSPEWVAVPLGLFDSAFEQSITRELHLESVAQWGLRPDQESTDASH